MKKENALHIALVVMSALTLIIVAACFVCMKSSIMRAVENVEAMKVGGKENYEKLKQLYNSEGFKAAQSQQIDSALSQMNGQPAGEDTQAGAQQEQFPSGTINADQLAKMKEGTYVHGKKDAKFTIIEYTDPECPFCIRHYNDKTIENLMAKYDVNHIVKAVQGVNHAGTEYKSLALLCAGKLGGEKAYYGMYDKIVGGSTPQTVVPNAQVATFAKDLGLNAKNFSTCLDTKELLSVYSANRQEALSYKSSGTPGNLVINNEDGSYKLVSGAYPVDTFSQLLDTRGK